MSENATMAPEATLPGIEVPTSTPPADTSGAGGNDPGSTAPADGLEAARAAFGQTLPPAAGPAKRGPGRPITSGKYVGQRKKKKLPMGEMGAGSVPLVLPDDETPAEEIPGLAPAEIQPAFDAEANRPLLEAAIKGFDILHSTAWGIGAEYKWGQRELSEMVADVAKMPDMVKELATICGMEGLKEARIDLRREWKKGLVLALVILEGETLRRVQSLVSDYQKKKSAPSGQ